MGEKEKPIIESFKLNEIKGFTYDEKTNNCSFVYNDRLISGKLVLFKKITSEILVKKDIRCFT